jgi:hypothetical protein
MIGPKEREQQKIERQTRFYRDAMPLVVLICIAISLFSLSNSVKESRVCGYYVPPSPVEPLDDTSRHDTRP